MIMSIRKYNLDILSKLEENEYQLDSNTIDYLLQFKKIAIQELKIKNNNIVKVDKKWRTTENQDTRPSIVKNKSKNNLPENDMYLQLNKLSESNLETVSILIDSIIEKSNDKNILIEKLIIRLFQCAKIQIHFCHLYAELFYMLIKKDSSLFKKNLESKIKLEFQNIKQMGFTNGEQSYDENCNMLNIKDNYIGCYQFCIELYNHNVLTYDNIEQIINNICVDFNELEKKEKLEIIVEALCRILETVKKNKRFTENQKKHIVEKIKLIFNENRKKLNIRSQFILEDVLDKVG